VPATSDGTRNSRLSYDRFEFREPPLTRFLNRQKVSLFRWVTRQAPPLYLCGGDVMTIGPMVTGYHEPEVLHVLAFLAKAGYNRALIDIGANTGLITWRCKDLFQSFHCFEPNPRVFHVLAANLFDPADTRLHLHNVAIGERDETSTLTVPAHNQGGAFISGASNAYDADVLGDRRRIDGDLQQLSVTVRRGRDVFRALFDAMPGGMFTVKIDAEGFEQTIIRELAAATPVGARIAIVFENLQREFDAAQFMRGMGWTGTALKLIDNLATTRTWLAKELRKLVQGKLFRLTDRPPDWLGTVVLLVEGA
jgi:FkbM family methyltransferase